jgi:hypothetical protein
MDQAVKETIPFVLDDDNEWTQASVVHKTE